MTDTKRTFPGIPLAVSLRGAAELSSLSESIIDQAIRSGLLPVRSHGNRILIRMADLMAWIDSMPVGRRPSPPHLEGHRTGRPRKNLDSSV